MKFRSLINSYLMTGSNSKSWTNNRLGDRSFTEKHTDCFVAFSGRPTRACHLLKDNV